MNNVSSCYNYDSMTGLGDRSAFFQDVRYHIELDAHVHIIVVQLSHLAHINRRYGVQVGDQLIRVISEYLKELDEEYTAYRIGNSRLVLMGGECTQHKAEEFVEGIHKRFQKDWRVSYREKEYAILSSACLLHLFLDPRDTENDLLDKINYTISMVPSHEEDNVIFFDEAINADMQRKRYVLEEVRYAIENKMF